MNTDFQLFPDAASTAATRVDALFISLCAMAAFFTALIFCLIVFLSIRYRRKNAVPPPVVHPNRALEITWTVIPFIITMVIFFWGAKVYFYIYDSPKQALEINVVGKQWMWKVQHPNGKREIDQLHVPLGTPVRLRLASQDVIHSFFMPAFRIKQDAVPGRFTECWFQATKLGESHLFCAEYCGTQHSGMIGTITVMEPEKYQAWLVGTPIEETPEQSGAKLFSSLGCQTCHGQQAPTLAGVYGSTVQLEGGRARVADDAYLRDSILDSTRDIVRGYAPLMPSFRGQISEEQLSDLIAYIKSIKDPAQLKKAQ
jgi:cytochrome c oxidase subunit 2